MNDGQFETALEHFETGLRMAPFGQWVGDVLGGMALAQFFLRNFGEAADLANRAISKMPENPFPWRTRAAALAHVGRAEEARDLLQHFMKLFPSASTKMRLNYRHQWMGKLLIDGLRQAGLPE